MKKLKDHSDAFEKLAAAKEEVKKFVLTAIKTDDFMFTDLFDPNPAQGISGVEDIKARISDFLVQAGIRNQEDVKLIFPPDDNGTSMEPIEILKSFDDEEVLSDETGEI